MDQGVVSKRNCGATSVGGESEFLVLVDKVIGHRLEIRVLTFRVLATFVRANRFTQDRRCFTVLYFPIIAPLFLGFAHS